MKMKVQLIFLGLCLFSLSATADSSKGISQVISVPVDDRDTAEFLSRHDGQLDFWNNVIIGKSTHILIEPSQTGFLDALTSAGIGFEVMIDDVDAYAERSMARVHQKRLESKNNNDKQAGFDFGIYHTIEEINGFIDYVNETYPNTFIDKMGFSYEGRWVRILKICPTGRCESNIPTMYIQCNTHAREWVTDAVCLYMINELTANAASHADILTGLQWYILPSHNPDGYAFTWSDNRFWRKNRNANDPVCVGVDLNRNYGDHFDEGGSSNNSCSYTYHGPAAFSEQETKNTRDYVLNHPEIAYFQDLHSYSQLIMFPYGFSENSTADHDELGLVCDEGNVALYNVHKMNYTCGSIAQTLYVASGSSVDWSYDKAGIKYSYTFEARPEGDLGDGGFVLPEEQLIPCSEEIFAWHETVAMTVKNVTVPRSGLLN